MGLIMEYMSGGSLRILLFDDDVVLHMNLRLRMSSEIANGISFLHNFNEKHRLVHGDLKPDNILLTMDLHCKIADFGGAKMVKYSMSTPTHTEATQGQMTEAYAAPERLSRTSVPAKEQDTYSFGLIIHGILSRHSPIEGFLSENAYLQAIKQGGHPSMVIIDTLKRDSKEGALIITVCLESVMTRCWKQDPASRPAMLSIRGELSELLRIQPVNELSRSVAEAQSSLQPFRPCECSDDCLPLHCFNTSSGTFNQRMIFV